MQAEPSAWRRQQPLTQSCPPLSSIRIAQEGGFRSFPRPSCDRNRPGYTLKEKKASGCRTIRIHLTVQPVLSYEEATHGRPDSLQPRGIPIIKRLKWHTKGSTKHFAS